MSSNLETRISRNIARQKENFKRQQKIISSFNEDFLNNDDNINSAMNEVEPSRFMNELDASLSQIRATGNEEADLDGNGGGNDISLNLSLNNISGLSAHLKDDESKNIDDDNKLSFSDMVNNSNNISSTKVNLSAMMTPTQGLLQQQLLKVQQFRRASKEMQKTVFSLEQQLEKLENEKNGQQIKFEKEKSTIIRKFDTERKKAKKKLAVENAKFEKLKVDESLKHTTRLKRVNKERHNFEKQIKKLQGKVEILNTQNQDLKEQNTDLMGKIRSSDETERSNLSSILELRDQLSKRLSQITALENDIQSKNKVIKELSSRAASNEMSKKSNFENERLELAEEIATLSMQLNTAKKKNEKIPRLEKQIMSAKSVEKKHKEAMKELKKIQKENDSLIAETKNLQLECSKNKNNFKEMSRSLLTYKKGKKAKENIIAELKKRLEASATEMKEYELLQTKYKQQTDNYQQVLREKQKLIKSLTDCKQTLEVTAEKSKLVEEIPKLNMEITSLKEKLSLGGKTIQQRDNEIVAFQNQIALHEGENNQLHEALTTERDRSSNLLEKVTILEIETDRLKRELEDYKEKDDIILSLEEEATSRNEEIEKLNDEKRILKATISELEEVHRRVDITNRALNESKMVIESLKREGLEQAEQIKQHQANHESTKLELKKTFKALTIAMHALLPCMVRSHELSTQKRFAMREHHRLHTILMETNEKLEEMNIKATNNNIDVGINISDNNENKNLQKQTKRKKSFRTCAIAIIAANRLLRFAGIQSSIIPISPNAFYQTKNTEPYNYLGKKISTSKHQSHIDMYLADPPVSPTTLPSNFLTEIVPTSPQQNVKKNNHKNLSLERNALVQLINHFKIKRNANNDGIMDNNAISQTLDDAGLLLKSPQISLLNGLLRGQNDYFKVNNIKNFQPSEIYTKTTALDSFLERLKSVRSIEKKNMKDLEEKSSLWEADLKSLNTKHKMTILLVEERNIEISALKKSIEKLEAINSKLISKKELNHINELYNKSVEEFARIKEILSKEKDKHKKTRKALKELKSKYSEVSVTLEEQGQNIKTFDANSARLKGLLASQKRISAKKSSIAKSIESKLNEANAKNDDIQEKLNVAKRKNWEDRRRLEENTAQVTRQLNKKSKQFDSVKEKLTTCKAAKKELEKELETLQEKYYEMRKDHRKQMASVAQDLSKAREENYPDINLMKKKIDTLNEEKIELKNELKQMHKILKSKNRSSSSVKHKKEILILAQQKASADLDRSLSTITTPVREKNSNGNNAVVGEDGEDNIDDYLSQIDKKLFQKYGTPSSRNKTGNSKK